MSSSTRSRRFPLLLYGLFFLSGASALIFETLWQRMMILVFGASAHSTTAILTAFFVGIALGSWWGGKLLSRFRNPLHFYALVELTIGVFGCLVPILLHLMDGYYVEFFRRFTPGPFYSYFFRFFMCVLVILPATIGMGATIPVMSRLLSDAGKSIGKSISLAYGLNTIGAVLGCLATGLHLIPRWGIQASTYVALGINGVVVVVALLYRQPSFAPAPDRGATPFTDRESFFLTGMYFTTGLVALGLEIVWMRILAIYCTSGVTTFTLALSTYLLGFSTGSLVIFPWLSRRMSGLSVYYLSSLGVGAATLLMVPLFHQGFASWGTFLPELALKNSVTFGWLVLKETRDAFIFMLLPTVFMGMAFPAVCQMLTETREKIALSSGFLYSIGTLGSALGIVITALLLIPTLGLVGTLGALCLVSALLALGALGLHRNLPGRRFWSLGTSVVALVALVYGLVGMPFSRLGELRREGSGWTVVESEGQLQVLRYRSGSSATVMTTEGRLRPRHAGRRELFVDGQVVASSYFEYLIDAKMLAHIPLSLHPDPRVVLTVGFGSGGTCWSMSRYGVDVVVAEIEEEVLRSAHLFESQNQNVLTEPNLTVVRNDARDFLKITEMRFDVISTDVTNLQYKQNGSLYTADYFALMKSRLTEDGIACAWIPLLAISEEELKTVMRSFQQVYPHTSLWFMDYASSMFGILLGTPTPLRIDLELVEIEHPYDLVNLIYLDENGVRQYAGEGPLHTDDHPILEFSSSLSYFYGTREFVKILHHILELRPGNLEPYVVNLEEKDVPLFQKYARFSALWAQFTRGYFFDRTPAEIQMRTLEEARRVFPEKARINTARHRKRVRPASE